MFVLSLVSSRYVWFEERAKIVIKRDIMQNNAKTHAIILVHVIIFYELNEMIYSLLA